MHLTRPAIPCHSPTIAVGGSAFASTFLPCGCRQDARWLCVLAEHRQEHLAEHGLRTIGLPAWLPLIESKWTNGHTRIVPMFPGYLFVQAIDDRWRKAYSTRGVRGLICHAPERPTSVPVKMLELLWRDCAPNGVLYLPRPKTLAPATPVELVTGPFAGFRGIVRMATKDRVRLLVNLLGRDSEVEVPRADVAVLSAAV